MKKGIHPEYKTTAVKCATCGNEFEIQSTLETFTADTCSVCHPAYTGKQRVGGAKGRVEQFNKKYGIKE